MIRRAEVVGDRIVTRTMSDPFGVQQSLNFLVDRDGAPVGLEIDGEFYRIKRSPRLWVRPDWRFAPMLEVQTVALNGEPETDPAA
jgi:hypothetical protein